MVIKPYFFLNRQTYREVKKNKVNRTTEAQPFHSSDHHKWLSYQLLGSKTVKNVKSINKQQI